MSKERKVKNVCLSTSYFAQTWKVEKKQRRIFMLLALDIKEISIH